MWTGLKKEPGTNTTVGSGLIYYNSEPAYQTFYCAEVGVFKCSVSTKEQALDQEFIVSVYKTEHDGVTSVMRGRRQKRRVRRESEEKSDEAMPPPSPTHGMCMCPSLHPFTSVSPLHFLRPFTRESRRQKRRVRRRATRPCPPLPHPRYVYVSFPSPLHQCQSSPLPLSFHQRKPETEEKSEEKSNKAMPPPPPPTVCVLPFTPSPVSVLSTSSVLSPEKAGDRREE